MRDTDQLRHRLMTVWVLGSGAALGCDRGSEPASPSASVDAPMKTEAAEGDPLQPPTGDTPIVAGPTTAAGTTGAGGTTGATDSTGTTGTAAVPTSAPKRKGPRGTCPNGDWCGTKATAAPLANGGPLADGGPTTLGCPNTLDNLVAGATDPTKYEGLRINSRSRASLDAQATKDARAGGQADACCYHWVEQCPGGRPILDRHERMVRSELQPSSRVELEAAYALDAGPDVRRRAAAAWLEDSRCEHASIASFERNTAELRAVGAPARLVAGSERAAADEAVHARLCREIAWGLGAARVEPGPLAPPPAREPDLARLAVDTFIEGCVGETLAALAARRAAHACEVPKIAEALLRIAADEERHATLAWETVAWAVSAGGARVAEALRASARAMAPRVLARSTKGPDLSDDAAGLGRLDSHELEGARTNAWSEVIVPLLEVVVVGTDPVTRPAFRAH